MLEGDDIRDRAFALFLRLHPGAFRQLMCPNPGEFAHFLKKYANARGEGRAWALLELTDALHSFRSITEATEKFPGGEGI